MRTDHGAYVDALPTLDPILAFEVTGNGWRGLTGDGEVVEVRGEDDKPAVVPDGDLVIVQDGKPIGRRAVRNEGISIGEYLEHFERSLALFRQGRCQQAINEIELALAIAPTVRGRMNRAMMLLSVGRWPEGFAEYAECESAPPFQRPNTKALLDAGIRQWTGESMYGKRLLLVHDHGFGDTLMMLRYVPLLKRAGVDVTLSMPRELRRIAAQLAPVTANSLEIVGPDYFCSMLLLLHALKQTPELIPAPNYLRVEPLLRERWRERFVWSERPRIGIAWSVGVANKDDYPREIPLAQLLAALPDNADVFSVQTQRREEAEAQGVFVPTFEDFADCAALMSLMDTIVTVDTAAVHLAGSIGHPKVNLLLSSWASWRWEGNPFYPDITICRQHERNDWDSALRQLSL